MSGHTKGPWAMRKGPFGKLVITDTKMHQQLASLDAPMSSTPEKEVQANARLITAAPALLRYVKEYGYMNHGGHDPGPETECSYDECHEATKLLKQAEGSEDG